MARTHMVGGCCIWSGWRPKCLQEEEGRDVDSHGLFEVPSFFCSVEVSSSIFPDQAILPFLCLSPVARKSCCKSNGSGTCERSGSKRSARRGWCRWCRLLTAELVKSLGRLW